MRISDWSSDVCSSDLRPDRRRPEHVEGVGPADLLAPLAPPAHLVQAGRGDGTEQREARCEWEQHGQHAVYGRQPGEDQSGARIDDAHEEDFRAVLDEIAENGRAAGWESVWK